jgi:hypothetical protein
VNEHAEIKDNEMIGRFSCIGITHQIPEPELERLLIRRVKLEKAEFTFRK